MGQNGTGIGRGRFGGGAKLGGLAGLAASTLAGLAGLLPFGSSFGCLVKGGSRLQDY